jgi:hypothetical protein
MCDKCGNDHPNLDELIAGASDKGLLFIAVGAIGALVESFTSTEYADPDTYLALSTAIKLSKQLEVVELTDKLELLKSCESVARKMAFPNKT